MYFCNFRQYSVCTVYVLYAFRILDVQIVLFKLFSLFPLKFIHNNW